MRDLMTNWNRLSKRYAFDINLSTNTPVYYIKALKVSEVFNGEHLPIDNALIDVDEILTDSFLHLFEPGETKQQFQFFFESGDDRNVVNEN